MTIRRRLHLGRTDTITVTLPAQGGHAGQMLSTNGSNLSWKLALPTQSGHAGQVLSTDGTNPVWVPLIIDGGHA